MAAKLKLQPAPTFKAKVPIEVAGGDAVPIEFEFKHRTKAQLDEFSSGRVDKLDVDSIMDMVTDWDFDEPFNRESVELLLENYIGAPVAIYRTYIDELVKYRVKN